MSASGFSAASAASARVPMTVPVRPAWRPRVAPRRCPTAPRAASVTLSPMPAPGDFDHRERGASASEGTIVQDDLEAMLTVLPADIRGHLRTHPNRNALIEIVLDLGRRPEARFQGLPGGIVLRETEVTKEDLKAAEIALGTFGGDNRAGLEGTLHRISAIRNRRGAIVGLTCRVGRTVTGQIDMVRDLLETPNSILFLGRPGVGKTTVIHELARVLSQDLRKRVVISTPVTRLAATATCPTPPSGPPGACRSPTSPSSTAS